jgi:hypothetical protein
MHRTRLLGAGVLVAAALAFGGHCAASGDSAQRPSVPPTMPAPIPSMGQALPRTSSCATSSDSTPTILSRYRLGIETISSPRGEDIVAFSIRDDILPLGDVI